MKRLLYIISMIFLSMTLYAQKSFLNQNDKLFNWGIKAGLNAMQPDVSSIQINGIEINNIHSVNDVGYNIELFGRFNMHRFFLQPSLTWKYAKGNIQFNIIRPPLEGTNFPVTQQQSISMKIYSFEAPFVIGFYVVKERPYVLSVMAGTKLKYYYSTKYNSGQPYIDSSSPYYLSTYAAVEVIIGKFTFDFGYEYGINKMTNEFEYVNNLSYRIPMKMRQRIDGINMSVGFLF